MLSSGKLGFWGLTALVFGLMVGVGIFNLPQNMAQVAAPGSVAIAWIVTGAGILPLVIAFKWLSDNYPQYNAGLYQYAQAGFGNLTGFLIAWGYWLCTAFSNVTYGVMLNDAMGAFFPFLLDHSWPSIIFGSVLIWVMFAIVACGIRTAKFINNLLAVIKVVLLTMVIVIFAYFFKLDLFTSDIWGNTHLLGDVAHQVKSTMMVTLFCFFGVEGAVMMSARAKRPSDVGKAGFAGFFLSLVLYLAVSLLCFGLMARAQLAGLDNPSVVAILGHLCGPWAFYIVMTAIIISLLGGWVSWTLVVAQVPFEASKVKILPPSFSRVNRHDSPTFGLIASSIAMEVFLLLVFMADDVYLTALQITGLMIIPGYLFTGLFLLKVANTQKIKILAVITVLFCLWMAYAGGLKEMIMTSVFYIAGIGFYVKARKSYFPDNKLLFTRNELIALVILAVISLFSIVLLFIPT